MRRSVNILALTMVLTPLLAAAACTGGRCVYIPAVGRGASSVPGPSAAPTPSQPPATPSPRASTSPSPSSPPRPTVTPSPTSSPPQGMLTWTELTGSPSPIKRSEALGAVVGGKLYLFSGYTYYGSEGTHGYNPTRRVDVFDPGTQQWTRLNDMPKGFTHAGVANDAENVYFAGGYTENATQSGQIFRTAAVWKYSAAADAWSELPSLPAARAAGALAILGRTLHFFGGHDRMQGHTCNVGSIPPDKADHWALNLDDLAAGWVSRAALENPRNHLAAVALDGKIYAVGGQRNCDSTLVTQRDVDRYDPATDTWTPVAPLPAYNGTYGRGHITNATFVRDGKIVVAGGEYRYIQPIAEVVEYSPATNTWSQLTPLPAVRYSGIARPIGSVLYFATGSTTNAAFTNTLFRGTFGSVGASAAPDIDWRRLLSLSLAPVLFSFLSPQTDPGYCSVR